MFELGPIRDTYLNEKLKLRDDEVAELCRCACRWCPSRSPSRTARPSCRRWSATAGRCMRARCPAPARPADPRRRRRPLHHHARAARRRRRTDAAAAAAGVKGAPAFSPCVLIGAHPRCPARRGFRRLDGRGFARPLSGYSPCPYCCDRGEQCAGKSVYSRRPIRTCTATPATFLGGGVQAYRDRMAIPYQRR